MPRESESTKAARALAGKRWKKTTAAQRTAEGKRLAKSRWDQADDEARAAVGARLAEARRLARQRKKDTTPLP